MEEKVYHTNFKLEDTYWWFVARNSIIQNSIGLLTNLNKKSKVLDVGCGTGGFASKILDDYEVYGMDTSELALEYSKSRGIKNLFLGTLQEMDKSIKFDAITILDVIEHIEDDKSIVKECFDRLKKDGYIIASVPAYMFMWSHHDVKHMHYRRYTKRNFKKLIKSAGFELLYSSYFNTLLFPLAIIKRYIDKLFNIKKEDMGVDEVSDTINNILKKIFKFEINLIPKIQLPFGLSILVIAKKK